MSKPLSREFLLERGKCCKNSCKNCPWGFGKRLIDRITNLQLEQNLLMSRVDDLINKTKNMEEKENIFELEEIPIDIRWKIYDLLHPEIFIFVRTSPDCGEWLTKALIPTHKIKLKI
jgi:hypothetical protein